MRVTILGSGTAVPSLQRNSAGVLIQTPTQNVLVDMGYGTVHQLLRLGLTCHDVDRVLFTHAHPDHICDLVYFLFSANYVPEPRVKDLPIVAAPGFGKFLSGVQAAFRHWLTPATYQIVLREQDTETVVYGDLTVTTGEVDHSDLSRAFRLTGPDGVTVTLSGDTDECPGIVELGREADLLILECSTPDAQKVAGHLTPAAAGRIARESRCKSLCLTHFYPPMETEDIASAVRREYAGPLILAKDRMEIPLTP